MTVSDDFIIRLKSVFNIEDIISRYVSLKNDGRNKKALCLFHSERTPSMVVYNDTQSFYCFGCGVGGDVITFIMKVENLDYIEALKLLSSYAGIEFPNNDSQNNEHNKKSIIYEINRESAHYFHKCLKLSENSVAVKYLHNRGVLDGTIIKYGLGYAPNNWTSLLTYLRDKGYKLKDIESAALISKSKSGNYYDLFRNRIMFPIIDLRGNVIGFGGRVLDDSKPKYLNSSDTAVFKKSNHLFSMNFAKNEKLDKLILVEGYMDTISLYQAGFKNVVATLGTALTSSQSRLISRYVSGEVILAYDADNAGRKATDRAFNLLSEVGISVKVISMNGCKDPDEYVKKNGAKRFEILINKSIGMLEFEFESLRQKYNFDIPNQKVMYVKDCIKLLSKIESTIEREIYISKISDQVQVSKDVLRSNINETIKKAGKYYKKRFWNDVQSVREFNFNSGIYINKIAKPRDIKAEHGIIYFLMKNPDYCLDLERNVDEAYFVSEVNKKIFFFLLERIKSNKSIDFGVISSCLDEKEMNELIGIDSKFRDIPVSQKQLFDYIDILKSDSEKMGDDQILNMTPEQIKNYYLNKRK